MFLNFLGNIFASREANFVSTTMFPEVGKQGKIDREHNVSATMFPSLPRLYFKSTLRVIITPFGRGDIVELKLLHFSIESKSYSTLRHNYSVEISECKKHETLTPAQQREYKSFTLYTFFTGCIICQFFLFYTRDSGLKIK